MIEVEMHHHSRGATVGASRRRRFADRPSRCLATLTQCRHSLAWQGVPDRRGVPAEWGKFLQTGNGEATQEVGDQSEDGEPDGGEAFRAVLGRQLLTCQQRTPPSLQSDEKERTLGRDDGAASHDSGGEEDGLSRALKQEPRI
ncbi:unnamed protein product [Lampetra planeri]